ncbi:MAG TPA: methyl-accepting chemotaxis protein [Polyangiaceae bacterium]|jgi:methyl-accepting chemotaxis protein|nr:methyl-accepting chemotaxis protein [Polyangiaceae bacterium]
MRWPKLSLRGKIMGTIIIVTAVVVALGAWKASDQIRAAEGTGQYLKRDFNRELELGNERGTAELSVVKVLASDADLGAALAAGDATKINDAERRTLDALQGTAAPDLFAIVDTQGAIFGVPAARRPSEGEWRSSRLFSDLREGKVVHGKFGLIDRHVYRLSATPVKNGDKLVGAVLLGQDLARWFEEVATRSGTSADNQYHFALVMDEQEVVASALPPGENALLLKAMRHPETVRDGNDTVRVLDFGDKGLVDFWTAPVTGYTGSNDPDTSMLGSLYLVRSRESKTQAVHQELWQVAAVFGFGLLLALVMGFLLAVQITSPLRRYIGATEALSRGQGDLSKRLEVETKDELGELAGNLNRVFAKIHSLAAGVQRTAFQVNASSGEISGMSRKLLDGAKEQAAKVSNSTAAVTELSSSIQQVAENAAEATRTAKQSGEAVTRAIERLQLIRKTVEEAAQRIAALGESGKRIGNIVEVIRQISEQTSMLALNAAIEAAHAGEHGRGFAVVADEVSSLAKRTGQSARDIEDLIAAIRDQTGEAVRSMQLGTREVEEGTGLVETTLADLKTLISVIDDTASAVQEQAIASDEIARNMDAVQRIAGAAVGSSENAVAEGERLQRLAEELEQSVKGFKIDPERVALDDAELKALPRGDG